MTTREEIDRLTASLRDAFSTAWQEIKAEELAIASDPTKARRRARLRELEAMVTDRMDHLDTLAEAWLSSELPLIYRSAGEASAEVLGEAWAWTQPDLQAITALAQSGFDDLLRATTYVREDVKRVVRSLARERALVGRITGETATQSAKRLANELRTQGLKSIVYRDGSKHGLDEYADMVIRTTTAKASAAGQINTASRFGVEMMTCLDSPDCGLSSHGDDEKPNGLDYPLDVAAEFAVAHPRCVRDWTPSETELLARVG